MVTIAVHFYVSAIMAQSCVCVNKLHANEHNLVY